MGLATLAARAEEIAAMAWRLSADITTDATAQLAAALDGFSHEVNAVAGRVGHAVITARRVADIMEAHAGELAHIAEDLAGDADADAALLRSRLTRLVNALDTIPEHTAETVGLAGDIAGLSGRAVLFAARARALTSAANPAQLALDIARDMRGFAEAAAAIAVHLSADATRAREATQAMELRARQLAVRQLAVRPAAMARPRETLAKFAPNSSTVISLTWARERRKE